MHRWVEQKKKFTEEEAKVMQNVRSPGLLPSQPPFYVLRIVGTPGHTTTGIVPMLSISRAGARLEGRRERVQRRAVHAASKASGHLGRVSAAVGGSACCTVFQKFASQMKAWFSDAKLLHTSLVLLREFSL